MTITILDGGMGQELVARSPESPSDLWSIQYLLDSPELIAEVHRDYFAAGAEIATINSYSIHRERLRNYDLEHRFEALHRQACEIAIREREKHGSGLVAGALGPIGWSYRPDLAPPVDQAAEIFAEIALIQRPYVDLILCETMSSVDEARGAAMGAKASDKPVWLCVSVDDQDGTRLRSGESISLILPLVRELALDALLVNCSVPEAINQALPQISKAEVPVGAYANGFIEIVDEFREKEANVSLLSSRDNLDPQRYADFASNWIDEGATIVGGWGIGE